MGRSEKMKGNNGCGKYFEHIAYSIVGTSFKTNKMCGWHNGNDKLYLCEDCIRNERK